MKTLFEWDGKYDIQPFGVTGTATTKTITTETTEPYVYSGANSLRFYANDAGAGKTVNGKLQLPNTIETNWRVQGRWITSMSASDWDNFNWWLERYDGTNVHYAAFQWNSDEGVANDIEIYNSSAAWEDIAGTTWLDGDNNWIEFDFIVSFGGTGVEPTYRYLRINEFEYTTFPDNGYTTADAGVNRVELEVSLQVDAGATRYMYLDWLKAEVW